MISCPLMEYWLPSSSVSGHESQTHTCSLDMSGKSCGTSGMVSDAGIEFSREGVVGSDRRCSCRASARVHFAVKSSSGAYASWVWSCRLGPVLQVGHRRGGGGRQGGSGQADQGGRHECARGDTACQKAPCALHGSVHVSCSFGWGNGMQIDLHPIVHSCTDAAITHIATSSDAVTRVERSCSQRPGAKFALDEYPECSS